MKWWRAHRPRCRLRDTKHQLSMWMKMIWKVSGPGFDTLLLQGWKTENLRVGSPCTPFVGRQIFGQEMELSIYVRLTKINKLFIWKWLPAQISHVRYKSNVSFNITLGIFYSVQAGIIWKGIDVNGQIPFCCSQSSFKYSAVMLHPCCFFLLLYFARKIKYLNGEYSSNLLFAVKLRRFPSENEHKTNHKRILRFCSS